MRSLRPRARGCFLRGTTHKRRMCSPRAIRATDIAACVIALACVATWFFVPPFQSPDEFSHIRAAYMLGGGKLFMHSESGLSSGGRIDTGLEEYFGFFYVQFDASRKISRDQWGAASRVRWSGREEFVPAPTSANIFPLAYLPHFAGLWIGKACGFSVSHSYFIAKFFCLMTVVGILVLAFRIYPPSPLTLCLLGMPMAVFQMASPTLDGPAMAVAVLALSLFMKIDGSEEFAWRDYVALLCAVSLLSGCRLFMAPLFLAVFYACFRSGRLWTWFASGASIVLVAAWTLSSISLKVDKRDVLEGQTCGGNLAYYLAHPLEFPKILAATLSDPSTLDFYKRSFIGVLGWLDTDLPGDVYRAFGLCLLLAAICSALPPAGGKLWKARAFLFVCGLLSVPLIFFGILCQCNPLPVTVIHSIQGRYFLLPAIVLSFAVSAPRPLLEGRGRKIALALVAAIFAAGQIIAWRILNERYFA